MTDTRPSLYRRHRFPPEIIGEAVWLYFRFPLSFRMVEDMLAYKSCRLPSLRQNHRTWPKFMRSPRTKIERGQERCPCATGFAEYQLSAAVPVGWLRGIVFLVDEGAG